MMVAILTMLSVTTLAAVAILGLGYWQADKRHTDLAEANRQLKLRINQAEQQLAALCSGSLAAGDHLVKLENRVQRVIERQDGLELRAAHERPYAQASELIHRGADIDDLVENCGLTRGEAELLLMMHKGAA